MTQPFPACVMTVSAGHDPFRLAGAVTQVTQDDAAESVCVTTCFRRSGTGFQAVGDAVTQTSPS